MTQPETPQEHCGHECVCGNYDDYNKFYDWNNCPCKNNSGDPTVYARCGHDTRKSEASCFIIHPELRASVVETLRMAGCPSIAERILEETFQDYHIAYMKRTDKIIAYAIAEHDKRPRPPCEECVYQSQSAEHDASVAKAPECPHWGIEHSDGMEWACSKTGTDTQRIADVIEKLDTLVKDSRSPTDASIGYRQGMKIAIALLRGKP